jgi:hypothetical protein
MKRNLNTLAVLLASTVVFAAKSVRADLEVNTSVRIHAVSDFHTPLSAHGAWVEVSRFGHCWRPAGIAAEWRPYCYGSWVWTDCGWYWVSDEPWAWAGYHYGWWTLDPTFGWIWVPGIEWAPAWVSWRIGGGHCGWAPLPPRGVALAPAAFVFVEERRFREPVRPSAVIVNDARIFNESKAINNVKRETRNIADAGPQRVVVNEGPRVDAIQKATGQTLAQVPIREAVRQTPEPQVLYRNSAPQGTVGPAATQPRPSDILTPVAPKPPGSPGKAQAPERGKGEDKGHDKK